MTNQKTEVYYDQEKNQQLYNHDQSEKQKCLVIKRRINSNMMMTNQKTRSALLSREESTAI